MHLNLLLFDKILALLRYIALSIMLIGFGIFQSIIIYALPNPAQKFFSNSQTRNAWIFSPTFLKVTNNSEQIQFPFLGGFNTPTARFADVNSDGKADFFVLDGTEFFAFRGTGSADYASSRHLVFENVGWSSIIKDWFLFTDINGDGKLDAITGNGLNSAVFYINSGTTTQEFFPDSMETFRLPNGATIFSESISQPALYDWDKDGDVDFFTGNSVGTIYFYRNIGTATQASWQFETDKFGEIIVGLDTVSTGLIHRKVAQEELLHGASCVEIFDTSADGKPDIFFGDYSKRGVLFFENISTSASARFAYRTNQFPIEVPISSNGFNKIAFLQSAAQPEMTEERTADFVLGVTFPTTELDNLCYYRNVGTRSEPQYSLVTKNYIPTLDIGRRSRGCLADVNSDGRLDACLGAENGSTLVLLRQSDGSFRLSPAGLTALPKIQGCAPALADLNGDGLTDAIIGDVDGRLRCFVNIGFANTPIFEERNQFAPQGLFGNYSSPALGDADGDGDVDIVCGNANGQLYYIENIGNAASPQWSIKTNFFATIDVGDFSTPQFTDVNSDGKLDVISGSNSGSVKVFIQNSTNFAFSEDSVWQTTISGIAPLGLLRENGIELLLSGCLRGGVTALTRPLQTTSISEDAFSNLDSATCWTNIIDISPNPIFERTICTVRLPPEHISEYSHVARIEIYSSCAERIAIYEQNEVIQDNNLVILPLQILSSGNYSVRICLKNQKTFHGFFQVLR